MYQWRKDIAQWKIGDTLYLSVVFTWDLPRAKELAKSHKGRVCAGGPAVSLIPEYLDGVAEIGGDPIVRPLDMHNPLATFTTRGCVNKCQFCAVPKIEGDLVELTDWPIRPVVCDNNLLAASRKHFDRVIDRLKALPFVDFNQGLESRKFTPYMASRIAELRHAKVRFAFDDVNDEAPVVDAIKTAREHGLRDFGVYVLVGYNDTPNSALYRLEKVREWGVRPNPMRYQPFNAFTKNSFVASGWTEYELLRMMKYYSRLRYLDNIPYNEFRATDYPLFEGIHELA